MSGNFETEEHNKETGELKKHKKEDKNNLLPWMDILHSEREEIKGSLIGDKAIRTRRPFIKGIKKVEEGTYEITSFEPKSLMGKFFNKLYIFLFGAPIKTAYEIYERLTKIKGLGVFASDNISSSAYATEEIMRVLMVAGVSALAFNLPITIVILILLAIVTTSYQQTIKAYPSGGGSYIVAKENLGILIGLIAAAALLIDYVLTVAVSISAGISAMVSVFPILYNERVLLCIIVIAILTLGNLRGIRESGTIFAFPVYIYVFSMFGVLGYGMIKYFTGALPTFHPDIEAASRGGIQVLGFFLILRAFSSGACGLTGVEAISNGVPAFKPPEARNARITMIWMAVLFGTLFFLISFLAFKIGIIPDPKELETVVSQIIKTIVGTGWAYYLVQFSTMLLLILAANTSFVDFPRLSYFLARDKFLPSHFGFRGDRLVFNNGIIALAVIAGVLIFIFKASVTGLIPLYTIGVFIAFTSSQAGMVAHWWRLRETGWKRNIIINAFGAFVTFVVLVVVGVAKFTMGAWIVLLLIPLVVIMLLQVKLQYLRIGAQIVVDEANKDEYSDKMASQIFNYILIPISDVTKPVLKAVSYARSLIGEGRKNIIINALYVTDDIEAGHKLKEKWESFNTGVPLFIIESPYRRLVRPILRYIEAIEKKYKKLDVIITILVPEVISNKWWEHFYHTNTALFLKAALLFRQKTVVISFPYHL